MSYEVQWRVQIQPDIAVCNFCSCSCQNSSDQWLRSSYRHLVADPVLVTVVHALELLEMIHRFLTAQLIVQLPLQKQKYCLFNYNYKIAENNIQSLLINRLSSLAKRVSSTAGCCLHVFLLSKQAIFSLNSPSSLYTINLVDKTA